MTNRISKFNDDDNAPKNLPEALPHDGLDLTGGLPEVEQWSAEQRHMALFVIGSIQKILCDLSKIRPDVFALRLSISPNGVHRLWSLPVKGAPAWVHLGDVEPPNEVSTEFVRLFRWLGMRGGAQSCVTGAYKFGPDHKSVTEEELSAHFPDDYPEKSPDKWPALAGGGIEAINGEGHPNDLKNLLFKDAAGN